MNWIKRLFNKKEPTEKCDIHLIISRLLIEYENESNYDRIAIEDEDGEPYLIGYELEEREDEFRYLISSLKDLLNGL